ncbi:hypothetical protein J6590_055434 [Homalodisca vitripennis]|nr:hypothetical protein J6590_055434 [Homalodisca vitripennis]
MYGETCSGKGWRHSWLWNKNRDNLGTGRHRTEVYEHFPSPAVWCTLYQPITGKVYLNALVKVNLRDLRRPMPSMLSGFVCPKTSDDEIEEV